VTPPSLPVNNSISQILSQTNNFYVADLPLQTLALLLESSLDLSACLLNCSNNGQCSVSKGSLVCDCETGYIGDKCHIKSSPCSHKPCLNNGTCFETWNNNTNTATYFCECVQNAHGVHCENKVNVCQNETCSSNGYCREINNKASCQCFNLYSGINCEIVASERKTYDILISMAAIIAIISICMLYSLVACNDLVNIFLSKKKKRQKRKETRYKPIYVPFGNLNRKNSVEMSLL
jgi:hypothetical protein